MPHPTAPFKAIPDLPIVGQPFTPLQMFPTLVGTCNCCEAKSPILIVAWSVSTCPKCGRGWQLLAVQHDIRTGLPPHFELNCILPGSNGNGQGKATP